MVSKTIYTKDSKGKIRFLTVESIDNTVVQTSGIMGTDKPVTHVKNVTGKNTGKSNATTDEEQAVKEAEAIIVKKLSVDYFESVNEAENSQSILPMLANDYTKSLHKVKFGNDKYYVQPKLDGMRCLAFIKDGNVKLISRQNKDITDSVPHIVEELKQLPDCILDGELYIHGETFQTIMTYLKKYRSGLTEKVLFHLYDSVLDSNYKTRYSLLSGMINSHSLKTCVLVNTFGVSGHKEIEDYNIRFVNEGYEGLMVRSNNPGYQVSKRSDTLLKYKLFDDIQLTILDIVPGKAIPTHGYPVYEWKGAKNDRLDSGLRMSNEEKEDLLTNKEEYIGKKAEVRFFGYTDDGVPRHPVTVGIRLDK